jgi:hypothetical protein
LADLVFWPIVLGIVVSIIVIWKNQNWQTTGLNGVFALLFWCGLYALLYIPNPTSAQYTQVSLGLTTLAVRFSNFARYFQMLNVIAEAWIGSLVVDSTTRFTKTHAALPYRIGNILDAIVFGGILIIFFMFMSGSSG